MPRRSKLDPVKDQILEWVRQGKDSRKIAELLKERGIDCTFQNVALMVKKWQAPILDKIDKKAQREYVLDAQKALSLLDGLVQDVMSVPEEGMSLAQRNAFRSKLEALREKLKILGAYAPENVTQVGVQVQVNPGDELRKWARDVLGESD